MPIKEVFFNLEGLAFWTFSFELVLIGYTLSSWCSNGKLAVYEIVDGVISKLWEGQCGDAPHVWGPRIIESQTANVWIWYQKEQEWPPLLEYG